MTYRFDLDAYLERVGYAGPLGATEETLVALHRLHPAAIPFEAIDPLVGAGVDLEPQAVDAKLIAGRRGGYCFEQNSVFKRALEALGFRVSALLARSRWDRSPDDVRPRTHMTLVVHLTERDVLADVGFGGCMMNAPIRLDAIEPQTAGFEPFRLDPTPDGFQLQVQRGGGWKAVYDMELKPQLAADFLTPNWWTSTHPSSVFRNRLLVTHTKTDVRHTLLDNRLTTWPRGGVASHAYLKANEVRTALADLFGLPWAPAWAAMVEDAVAMGRQYALGILAP